jgi:hypothetical protein
LFLLILSLSISFAVKFSLPSLSFPWLYLFTFNLF